MARKPSRPAGRQTKKKAAKSSGKAAKAPKKAGARGVATRGKKAAPASKRASGRGGTGSRRKAGGAAALVIDPNREPLMRASLAVSADGYIADVSGGVDWLNDYFSPEIDFMGFLRTIGATIYGRTTFDWAMAQGHAGATDPTAPGGRAIVLTRRPIENCPAGVEAFGGDVRELAATLRAELKGTGKDVWLMGGGRSIAPFHEAGLVDRWELSIIPILLGNGIPLFPPHSRGFGALRLTRTRVLENGIVEAWYEPKRG